MALREFVKAASAVKVKDVPSFLSARLTRENLSHQTSTWLANYQKHIDAGSFKPLRDMMVSTFCLAYVVAWPQEYKHYLHEQVFVLTDLQELKHAKAAGAHH